MYPCWSPDGEKIAFSTYVNKRWEIHTVNSDGTGQKKLIQSDYHSRCSWSPDGRKMAFNSRGIYIITSDGTGKTQLTYHPSDSHPSWSPDNRRIAFNSDRDGNPEIYVMNVDGTALNNVTNNPAADLFPAWSPILTKR